MNNVKVLNAVCPPLNLVSCAACMIFVYIFLHALIGYKKKVRKAPLVVFCVVLAALSILPIFLPEYFDITDIADATSTLCFIVFPYLVLKPYKKKTAFLWIGIAMAASLDYFAFIINYAFKLDTIGQMSAKVILYVLVFIAIMLTSDRVGDFDTIESFDRFPPVASLMIFAAFLAAYYSVTVSFNAEYTKETANALTMLSSVLIVGCIAYLVTKYLIALQRKRATEKQLELVLNHYNNMVQKNRDMRVFRHDFKNNLTSVRALISDGQYGEAEKYIDELYGRLDATKNAFSTGNHFADAILAEKSVAAAIWQTNAAFRNCGSLKITTVPDTVRMIDQVAFDGCGMTEFYLPDSVEYVGTQAFSSTPLTHFEFNDKVDTFKNIFSICPKLRTVVVGKGIKKIEIGALGGTNRIDTIYYRGTKSDWDKINVVDVASALKNIKIVYNYGQTSGVCGDNLTWSLQPDLFQITVEGSGDMYSYDNAEDFTWSSNADLVTGVVFGNGVTSVGKNAFNGFPYLTEVLLGSDVKNINSLAFANCGDLMTVAITAEGDTEIEYDAFDGHNEKFLLICDEKNTAAQAFALDNEMPLVTVSYDEEKKVINFKGTLTVFESVAGRYLAYYASRYPDAMYLHFDVLTFDGIKTADSTDGKRFECVDPDSEYLTFKDIYVKISVMKDGEEKDVTFGEMLERYENGDYDAFYAEIENDNGTDKSLVVKAFQAIFKPILKITSSIINFIKKLFK